MWYRCYYPHRLRDALSHVCGIFFTANTNKNIICKEYSRIYSNIQIFATLYAVQISNYHFGGTGGGELKPRYSHLLQFKEGDEGDEVLHYYNGGSVLGINVKELKGACKVSL